MSLASFIKASPRLKKIALQLVASEKSKRPRWWVRKLVNPFYFTFGVHTRISKYARLDVLPNHPFEIGDHSVIEDFTIVNNGMGAVVLGAHVFIGTSNVIIGPVKIESHVMTAQHVVFSGMNHGMQDGTTPYRYQTCTVENIIVGEGSWIGANSVILPGIQIGRFAIIAAGSVVTKNVPEHFMVAGNPAVPIKRFDHATKEWIKVSPPSPNN